MLIFFFLYFALFIAWMCSFAVSAWGGNGKASKVIFDLTDRGLGFSFACFMSAGWLGGLALISWETLISGHPILSVCVVSVSLGTFFLFFNSWATQAQAALILEIFHSPKWWQLLMFQTKTFRAALFGSAKVRADAEKRAVLLREHAAELLADGRLQFDQH